MKKRGQVTIFIIIAILVVAIIAVIFAVSPKLRSSISGETESPENFIQTCLEDRIEETVETISLQGGSLEPEFYYLYQDNKLQYLCYSNEYYKACNVQIPFIGEHIEAEIRDSIETDVDFCFNSLKENYKDSSVTKGEIIVDLLPQKIVTTVKNKFVFTQADQTETRESFNIILNNNLYELTTIAQNILEWETIYGGANPDIYMNIHSVLKVDKYEQSDETTVYILTDKNTDKKFQFASRSFAYSPLD